MIQNYIDFINENKVNEEHHLDSLQDRIDYIQAETPNMDDSDLLELVDIIKSFYGDTAQGEQTEDDVAYVLKHSNVVDDETIEKLYFKSEEMGY